MHKAARAQALLRDGQAQDALRLLQRAVEDWPESATLRMDLARAYGRAGRWAEADAEARRAVAHGASRREAAALQAVAAARTGDEERARAVAMEAGNRASIRLAAALGHPKALRQVASDDATPSVLGALGRYVLALRAAAEGREPAARALAESAAETAAASRPTSEASRRIANAAWALVEQLDRRPWLRWGAQVQATAGASTNPDLRQRQARGYGGADVDVGTSARVGPVQTWLSATGTFRQLTADASDLGDRWFGGALGLGVALPVGGPASAIQVALDGRVSALSADFQAQIASMLELGPSLWVPLGDGWDLRLGAYGVRVDVGSTFSPDAEVDPFNRDRTGQRVVLSAIRKSPSLQVELHGMFINDQADGEAFRSVGGGLGAGLRQIFVGGTEAWVSGRLVVRDFGPTLAPAFVGEGETVLELRAHYELGLSVPLGGPWFAGVRGSVLQNRSQGEGAFDEGLGQLEAGVRW